MLTQVSIGWRWLERTLNRIISTVNQQKPLGSSTIAIEESPNGTVLKVVNLNSDQPGGSGAGAAQQQQKPQPVVWHNVAWRTVTVVDPVSCAQSTITVLVQNAGTNLTIQ
jgi:hypothetical protein